MTIIAKTKRASRSKTIKWGHIQVVAGAIATGLTLFNPATVPDMPSWAYGVALIVSGMITYILRAVTRKPLDEK
jgi:uncharacterized membrane protein HdeD (DUF308 family)